MKDTALETSDVGIVADDLTSAADGACPFLARKSNLRIYRQILAADDASVVSLDTGSRNMSEIAAACAVGQAISSLKDRKILYKTIDSTLRGHVRAELAAAFHASGRDRLIIAPAFPAARRVTIGGVQLIDGQPVSTTSYGNDPVHPARTSRVLDLIEPSIGQVVVVPIGMSGSELRTAVKSTKVIVVDADNQAGLDRRVADLAAMDSQLWVGSPGMAHALAAMIGSPMTTVRTLPRAKRVLLVVGSANQVSLEQCAWLAENRVPIVFRVSEVPITEPIVGLTAPAIRSVDAKSVLTALVNEATAVLALGSFDAVIATGGETMDALLERLAIRSLDLSAEFEPGFPVGRTEPVEGRPSLIVGMKAGGFGGPATLLDAARRLLSFRLDRGLSYNDPQ